MSLISQIQSKKAKRQGRSWHVTRFKRWDVLSLRYALRGYVGPGVERMHKKRLVREAVRVNSGPGKNGRIG